MFGYTISGNTTQTLTVRSEKLPEITQSVYSINGTSYSNGDIAHPGDTVIFKVTVSKEAYEYIVNYSGSLTNSLSGAVFLGTSPTGTGTSSSQAVSISTTDSYSQTYYIQYTIPANTTGNVTNTVTFDYESNGRASSTSSTGAVDSTASYTTDRTANASATITVQENVVIQTTYITITKDVAGNMRESDRYFKFLVTINGTSGDTYTISGQDATVTYDGATVSTNSTYTVGSTNYIYLKSGQTVTIGLASNGTTTQIPTGITYTIVEQDAEDYVTTISGINGATKTTGTLTTVSSDNTVEFLNTKDAAALTGVNIKITAYIMLSFISVIFLIQIIINKRKYK